jgi:hypothetical protein
VRGFADRWLPASGRARAITGTPSYLCFASTSALIFLALTFAATSVRGPSDRGGTTVASVEHAYWADASWYRRIVADGYSYSPDRRSNVAYFPLYPLLGQAVRSLTGLSVELSLLVVSNAALFLCFLLLRIAAQVGSESSPSEAAWVLLTFGLYPVTFFFHLPYSEPAFFALTLLAFLGMRRDWSPVWVAAVIGLATATRPVGVALIPPFLLHLWFTRTSLRGFLGRSLLLSPVCLWGLLAYMAFLWVRFDDPLAFAHTQEHWHLVPKAPLEDRLLSLLALEPFWGYIDPESPFHWSHHRHGDLGIFSAAVMDRAAVVAWAFLTWLGWKKRWLRPEEVLLSVCLVGMAYFLRGYEMAFFSMGRFTTVAFPIYLVAGRILAAAPLTVSVSLLCISGFFLAAYTALFAAGYTFI